MNETRFKGSITVFLSLISVVFLSLICTALESVRVQGARAQAANIEELGNYSVFGEYEKKLLENYEIFAVDGSYGTGDFSIERVKDRRDSYLEINAQPKQEKISGLCFDPWQLEVRGSEITEYALLTDQNGESFYQQAVAYMKATALTGSVGKLIQHYQEAQEMEEKQENYEKLQTASDQEMEQLAQQEEEKKKGLEREDAESRTEDTMSEDTQVSTVKAENPLKALRKLKKKNILQIVCPEGAVSEKEVARNALASKTSGQKGTMKLSSSASGLISNLFFREYLLERFPNYLSSETGGKLDYQMEYILVGKRSDQENLKKVVQKLLLLREGMNYLYCVKDAKISAEAGSLAALLIGWTGIPALVNVMKHGLLLGLAYGESLMDVRILLNGGKIPMAKTSQTWTVTLERLGDLPNLLKEGKSSGQEGMTYQDYLRILLNLQNITQQKKRGLDMIELNLREIAGLSNFKVNHCIVGIRSSTEWRILPVFLRIPSAFLAIRGNSWELTGESSFAYS